MLGGTNWAICISIVGVAVGVTWISGIRVFVLLRVLLLQLLLLLLFAAGIGREVDATAGSSVTFSICPL